MAFYETNRSKNGFYKAINKTEKNMTFHAHLHTSFELLHVYEGVITVRVEGVEYRLEQGQQVLILPNLIHSYETGDEGSLTGLIIFSVDYLPEIYGASKKGLFRHPVLNDCSEEFDRLLNRQNDHFQFRAELYRIASHYERNEEISVSVRRNNEFAVWLSDYLENHCAERVSEKSLAKIIGYHPRYLSQLINQNFGVSFKVLLNEYRIRVAKRMLADSAKTITEIYTLAGFDSQSSFNRNFKLITGVTPREYRAERGKK